MNCICPSTKAGEFLIHITSGQCPKIICAQAKNCTTLPGGQVLQKFSTSTKCIQIPQN